MRTFILGLDGASPELIETWAGEGHLPTFQRLMDEGAWGRLTSTVPPLTPPAWMTSITRVNPGKHNVFDFTRPSEFVPAQSSYHHPFISPTDCKAKSIWQHLNEAGYTAGVMTFPFAYPPTPIQGYMFSELWGTENDYQSSPIELLADVARAVPGWFGRSPLSVGDHQAIEEKLLFDLSARFEVLRYLERRHPTDLTFVVFPEIDTAQHHFWHFMDTTHPWHDPLTKSPFEHTILRCYQQADIMLAQLLDQMSSDTYLIVYSDHGFGPLSYDVFINRWLIENGFMVLKETAAKKPSRLNRAALGQLARGLGLTGLTRRIPEGMKSRLPMPAGEFDSSQQIDWERTRVYFSSLSGQSLMVNLKGREPWGIVSGSEYERICADVIARLKTLRHEVTGQPILTEVHHREEAYDGPFVSRAPDIIAQCASGYQLQHGVDAPIIQPVQQGVESRSGIHAPEGMALLRGPGIRANSRFHAHIADVAPTILHTFGLSAPDMDGRMLDEVFAEPALCAVAGEGSSPYSPEQERKITERLRRLGYF
jgi:predicted AlkP superfamily phosphohydrolase/phosphomutase